jgi:hypothetical protein
MRPPDDGDAAFLASINNEPNNGRGHCVSWNAVNTHPGLDLREDAVHGWPGHEKHVRTMHAWCYVFIGGGGDTTGALWKISGGTVTELVPGQLTLPGDVAVARNGTIYVTNRSVFTGGGQVIAIQP